MATRGGKRPGAGRKRGIASIKAEEARSYMLTRIAQELEPILTGQIELAKGISYEAEDAQGAKKVYRELPDPRVAAFLLNQIAGKPKETVDMNVKGAFSLIELGKERDAMPKERLIEAPRVMRADVEPSAYSHTRPDPATFEAFKNRHPEYKKILDATQSRP